MMRPSVGWLFLLLCGGFPAFAGDGGELSRAQQTAVADVAGRVELVTLLANPNFNPKSRFCTFLGMSIPQTYLCLEGAPAGRSKQLYLRGFWDRRGLRTGPGSISRDCPEHKGGYPLCSGQSLKTLPGPVRRPLAPQNPFKRTRLEDRPASAPSKNR